MHPEAMISDARYAQSRILAQDAHRRLVAQAAPQRTPRHGLRYRIGAALIATGGRLQGIAPLLPEPIPVSHPVR